MGKHSYRPSEASQLRAAVVNPSEPVMPIVPAQQVELKVAGVPYVEFMNENLASIKNAEVAIEAPRRFSGLFTRSRVAVATLVAAMFGVSGVAMAATNDGQLPATVTPVLAHSSMLTQDEPLAIAQKVAISVTVDGATKTVLADEGASVGEALSAADIYLGENDEVSVSLSDKVREGMRVRVARVTTETISETFEEPFGTTEEKTDKLNKGDTKTITEGKNGSGTRTYTVYYRDGKEISREVAMEAITTKPVNEVVQVGTREEILPGIPAREITGSKADWMAAAGIPESEWGYVDFIVSRESGWNPNALNSSSGACGLVQALPCSKIGPNWNDPVVALQWGNSYVSRYGSWAGAVSFWNSHGWY